LEEGRGTHPDILLDVRSNERVTHDVRLERVQPGTRRSLERDPDGAHGVEADVRELVRGDEYSVKLVVANEDVPRRFSVLQARGEHGEREREGEGTYGWEVRRVGDC
jgi:hypothetical protein